MAVYMVERDLAGITAEGLAAVQRDARAATGAAAGRPSESLGGAAIHHPGGDPQAAPEHRARPDAARPAGSDCL